MSFIGLCVHKDQVGFIPGRQGPDQVRRAVDNITIMQSKWEGGNKQEGMLLSLDLQKAFDSVLWPYLFAVLRRWGFGPNILGILEALYSTPEARIRLQGLFSNPIKIARGTRQACPLSPLIFAIMIESLAIVSRNNPNIRGVRCGQVIHKCALFADDLLLFVTSPTSPLPEICSSLNPFAALSGLTCLNLRL